MLRLGFSLPREHWFSVCCALRLQDLALCSFGRTIGGGQRASSGLTFLAPAGYEGVYLGSGMRDFEAVLSLVVPLSRIDDADCGAKS